ncbi:MAG: T9SS type A sorting domain-containing protein [Fibrobacterota bacterium]
MSTLQKRLKLLLLMALSVSFTFGHLPSKHSAQLQMGRIARDADGGQRASRFTNKGEWDPSETYTGDYTTKQGDTVSYGTFNGKKLWWWAKFAADSTMVPGKFAPNGGTSPWVLINSLSAADNGSVDYTWKGYNGDMENMSGLDAQIPTWRDGAEGAYSFTHDDIGAMPYDGSVQPGLDVAKDFPEIKQCWGVFVAEMSEAEWAGAVEMVKNGHEIFNHSMEHTSASDQWQWFKPGNKVPSHDPAIPKEIRGLDVVGTWNIKVVGNDFTLGNKNSKEMDITMFASEPSGSIDTGATSNQGNSHVPLVLESSTNEWANEGSPTAIYYNDYVEIEAEVYWTGLAPASSDDAVKNITIKDNGVEKITLETGQELYVKYDEALDTTKDTQSGKLIATGVGWYEIGDLLGDYSNWYNGYYLENTWDPETEDNTGPGGQVSTIDKGRPGFLAKVYCRKGWRGEEYKLNIKDANDSINANVYDKIESFGEHFAKTKQSEYYGYPFDAYSEESHDSLENYGFVGARGGAKSGVPIPGDFFHPYRIDFDAFFITRNDWTVSSSSDEFVYPNNPHVLLGANEMVDEIVDAKGYMIREFHAVADIADGEWYNDDQPEFWPLNSAARGQGGWWGGITDEQLRRHYEYVQEKIDANKITVFTVGEVTKYRLTANATTSADIVKAGENYELTCETTEELADKYHDEISVIVSLDESVDSLGVSYKTEDSEWGKTPRRRPRQLDDAGKIWSVSVNPYLGTAEIVPNGDWDGPVVGTIKEADAATTAKQAAFAGIRDNRLSLNVSAGRYSISLFDLSGRMISKENLVAAQNGLMKSGISVDNLRGGMYILRINSADANIMKTQKIVIK